MNPIDSALPTAVVEVHVFWHMHILYLRCLYMFGVHVFPLQDTVVKQNLIRTIDLIGRALHPDHLKRTDFVFSKRGDLITHLLVRTCTILIPFYFPCLPPFSFTFCSLLLPHLFSSLPHCLPPHIHRYYRLRNRDWKLRNYCVT